MIYSAFRPALRPSVRVALDRIVSDLKLGPELLVNGDFDNGSEGWSVTGTDASHIATFAGGTLRYQSTTTSPQLYVAQDCLVTGKTYEVVITVTGWTSGSLKIDTLGASATAAIGAVGVFVRRGVAVQSGFKITRNSTNVDITIDKISVREILP